MSNFSSRNPSPTRDRSYGASSSSLAHALDFTVPKTPSPENPRVNGDLANIAQFSASNVHPHIMGPPLGQPQFTFSGPGGSDRVAVPGVNQPSTELSRLFKRCGFKLHLHIKMFSFSLQYRFDSECRRRCSVGGPWCPGRNYADTSIYSCPQRDGIVYSNQQRL